MEKPTRILAVANLAAEHQIAFERAAWLAEASGSEIQLLAVIHQPEYDQGIFHWHRDDHAAFQARRERAVEQWLRDQVSGRDLAQASVAVSHDHPFDQAVMNGLADFLPDIVFAQPRHPQLPGLSNSEWRLMRRCPAPLWLARCPSWPGQPSVLAAVDPENGNVSPASIDRDIIAAAEMLADTVDIKTHVLHALGDLPGAVGVAQSQPEYERDLRQIRLDRISHMIPKSLEGKLSIEASCGEPDILLPIRCEEIGVQLVIMGLIARHRIADLMIGSTARSFIPKSTCDVLLIRPVPHKE